MEAATLTRSARNFQYRGELAETGLPEILYSIDRFQVPGVIQAERDGVVKEVHLKEGRVVHASSSDLKDSLGGFLRRSGLLGDEAYERTMRMRAEGDRRFGVLLIEERILPPSEVYRAIREQVEAIVWSLFYWDEGAVTFSIGEFESAERVLIGLPMRQVIFQGIRRAPNAKALVARLGRKDAVFEPSFETDDLIEIGLEAAEYGLLRRVDGQRTLYELCTEGPLSPAENAKALYAFQVLRLIRKVGVVENPAGEPPPRQGPVKIRFKTGGDLFGG